MKAVFLIPIVLVGLVPFAYAEMEYGIDYDREITTDELGHKTVRHTVLNYDRIKDGDTYRDFIFTDFGSYLEMKTSKNKIQLDKSGCSFSLYNNDNVLLFEDSITAYNSVVDLYSWNAVTQINNASCEAYYDGNSLVAKRHAAGIGYMEYKYMFDKGSWKTQLEATNLSGLTDRVFGFDQTIDLNVDVIEFGSASRNLDNFDGQTFDRTFLENNESQVLNLLNGIHFDFDLGFEYLDSVSVVDTGSSSSKLIFHYMRNNEILLPNDTLIIDPTFTDSSPSWNRVQTTAAVGTSCSTTFNAFSNTQTVAPIIRDSDNTDDCYVPYIESDISSIDDAAFITRVEWSTTVASIIGATKSCDINHASLQPTTSAGQDILDDMLDGDNTVLDNNSWCESNSATGNLDLGSAAVSYVQSQLASDYVAFYFLYNNMTRDATSDHRFDGNYDTSTLTITYTTTEPSEFDVIINSDVVGDTNKINGEVTLTRGFPLPITLDSIVLLKDGTPINTNNTNSTFTALGQTVNFGDFWNRLGTGTYNFTASVTVDNATGSQITNASSSIVSREYDPSYVPAIDNPTVQGSVNATIERFDSEDGLLLKVNRIDVSAGDTWQIECIAQTNSQAASTKNQSQTWSGTWQNDTDVGYLNATFTGFVNSHAYVTCFNEDLLFTLTDFTDSSLALLGIQLFDDSYGSMIGVPVGIFFLVMTAGMANKRTAPTFIILITGIAGTMATIGFFSFEPLVWGLALVTAMLGIFVNQKIF